MTADPERGHRSIRLTGAHIFALPARLRTLRYFASSSSHKGSASFYFLSATDTAAFEEPAFSVNTDYGRRKVHNRSYTVTQSRESKQKKKRSKSKIVSHGKSCVSLTIFTCTRAYVAFFAYSPLSSLHLMRLRTLREEMLGNWRCYVP